MFTKKSIIRLFSILLVVLLMSVTASARPLDAPPPLGTGFTYQGKLTDGGLPANGLYNFEFKLYNSLSGGGQVGSAVTKDSVTVTNGLFTVQLDFGNVFDGTALYLQIGVRPFESVGGYTPLTPRQPLTAAPYALYAVNADQLDGKHAASFLQHYKNMLVVAKSGGDFTTITAALDTITTASATNPYLIYVAPGVYTEQVTMQPYVDIEGAGEDVTKITFTGGSCGNCGTVNIEDNAELRFLTVENTGGGNFAYAIYASCGGSGHLTHVSALASGGIVINSGIRSDCGSAPTLTDVTAIASGGGSSSYGVYLMGPATLTNVTAKASGGTDNYGVWNEGYWPGMTDVTASASGGEHAYGVYNNAAAPTMTRVDASAWGGWYSYGVENDSSSPTMMNVTASASCSYGTAAYGVYNHSSSPTMIGVSATTYGISVKNYGVYNDASSSPAMTGVTATASGGSYRNFGVYNNASSPIMTNVTASATGATEANVGVDNQSASPAMTNVVVTVSGGTDNYGVYNEASAAPTMTNVTATVSGGTNTYGVYNTNASPTMMKVTVIASGGTWNRGVANYSASPIMTGLTATVSGGNDSYGVWNDSSSVVIQNSVINASIAAYSNDGIHNTATGGAYTVIIDASQITGFNSTIYSDSVHYSTMIGASKISGGGVQGSGSYKCVSSYNGDYNSLNVTCH